MYDSNIMYRYTGESVWYAGGSMGNKSIDIDQSGFQIWQISTSSHFQRSFSSSNHGHIIVTLEQQGVSNGRIDPQRISAPPPSTSSSSFSFSSIFYSVLYFLFYSTFSFLIISFSTYFFLFLLLLLLLFLLLHLLFLLLPILFLILPLSFFFTKKVEVIFSLISVKKKSE